MDVEVLLLEQESEVAPSFPESFRRAVRDALVGAGVTVRTGETVTAADDAAVSLESGDDLAYDQLLWTGGITGSDAMTGDRPSVRADLRLGERTFAVGDAARIVDSDGEPVPASASAAIREASVAGKNMVRLVDYFAGDPDGFEPRLAQYRFDVPGWLVSVGDDAVAKVGPTVVTGKPAMALKTTVGAGYLGTVGAVRNATDLVREELNVASLDDAPLEVDDIVDVSEAEE
jgi:NADH dehydrogenase